MSTQGLRPCLTLRLSRIFEEASRCLNLYALKGFVKALIAASQSDLFYGGTVVFARLPPWSLLQRLSTLIMKLAKSGRPLSHLMHIWGVAAPHFVEVSAYQLVTIGAQLSAADSLFFQASCCKNSVIANRAVSCLHDVITAVIGSHFDLKNFYFNESLLQAYSTILCLDVSCNETQDQIVGAIAELVSMHKDEIYFGWKALFAALRAVRYPSCAGKSGFWNRYGQIDTRHVWRPGRLVLWNCSKRRCLIPDTEENAEHTRRLHTATVDIFVNFMQPGDLVVFSLAADDCLSTLLHLLNEPGKISTTPSLEGSPSLSLSLFSFLRRFNRECYRCRSFIATEILGMRLWTDSFGVPETVQRTAGVAVRERRSERRLCSFRSKIRIAHPLGPIDRSESDQYGLEHLADFGHHASGRDHFRWEYGRVLPRAKMRRSVLM